LKQFSASRDRIFAALKAENIGVNVHYIPVYLQPYYESLGYPAGLCSKAEQVFERIITIPLFPKMTDGDIQDVIQAVKKIYNAYFQKNNKYISKFAL
jgi:perosamine synthetase